MDFSSHAEAMQDAAVFVIENHGRTDDLNTIGDVMADDTRFDDLYEHDFIDARDVVAAMVKAASITATLPVAEPEAAAAP